MHAVLVLVVVGDAVQAALAGLAVVHGARRRAGGEHELARYSFGHARLLLAGAVLLAVPAVLGLTGALSASTAAWIVVACEAVGVAAAVRLHERVRPSPGSASAAPSSTSAAPAE